MIIRSDLTTLRGRATLFRDTSLAALLPTSFFVEYNKTYDHVCSNGFACEYCSVT